MRPINLRFWDEEKRKMVYFTLADTKLVKRSVGKPVMYATDKVDHTGRMIYEGDYVEKLVRNKPHSDKYKECKARYEIYWAEYKPLRRSDLNYKALKEDPSRYNMDPGFYEKLVYLEKHGYGSHDWSVYAQSTVVGNIYENNDDLSVKLPKKKSKSKSHKDDLGNVITGGGAIHGE